MKKELLKKTSRKDVMKKIKVNEEVFLNFQSLTEELKEEFLAFCMGEKGLKLTYDPFFKFIFDPTVNPERLSEFLSLLLGEEVEVVEVIPNESKRITEEGSLLITDIVVRLKSGAYANVEIQKIGYLFPGQRCACYSSDLLMRQLTRMKAKCKREKRRFVYKDLKKVYTIVLIEESTSIFWKHSDEYIHRGKQTFNTGLNLDLLQEYIIIPLDVFKKIPHNDISKLEAWLYFIGSDELKDINLVVEKFPEFEELYKEIFSLRGNIEELIGMYDYYRQLLLEADRETVEYMVEKQKKELEEADQQLEERKLQLEERKRQLEEKNQQLEETNQMLKEKDLQIEEQLKEIERLKALLSEGV